MYFLKIRTKKLLIFKFLRQKKLDFKNLAPKKFFNFYAQKRGIFGHRGIGKLCPSHGLMTRDRTRGAPAAESLTAFDRRREVSQLSNVKGG